MRETPVRLDQRIRRVGLDERPMPQIEPNGAVRPGLAARAKRSLKDGCTSIIRIDLAGSPGFGNANRSLMSSRASPLGKVKSGPEKW